MDTPLWLYPQLTVRGYIVFVKPSVRSCVTPFINFYFKFCVKPLHSLGTCQGYTWAPAHLLLFLPYFTKWDNFGGCLFAKPLKTVVSRVNWKNLLVGEQILLRVDTQLGGWQKWNQQSFSTWILIHKPYQHGIKWLEKNYLFEKNCWNNFSS